MNNRLFYTVLLLIFTVAANIKAQTSFKDSLQGFDENSVINRAKAIGHKGLILDHDLYVAKKEFIYEKYFQSKNNAFVFKTTAANVVQPACTNMGFESGSFFGWQESHGIITDCVTLAGCCPTNGATSSAVIAATPGLFDPIVPSLPIASPFLGSKVARINNSATGARVDRIEQTFNVTSSNAIFQIASACVLNSDPITNHCCNQQPGLVINIKDSAGTVLGCPYVALNAPSACCPSTDTTWHAYSTAFDDGYYRGWKIQTIDLSRYIGSNITVQITVMDCSGTAHYGYAYIDCQCLPIEFNVNGNPYNAAMTSTVNVSSCGSAAAEIFAPTGLNPYTWDGPLGSGISGVTTQSISTSTNGTYTLNMNPTGGCTTGGVIKYVNVHITPNPTVNSVSSIATCTNATGAGTVNITSGSSPFTYNWLPSVSTGSLANSLTPGTDYTVNVVDIFGCKGSAIISIPSFTNAPTYTISPLNADITCFNPTITVSANTATNTTAIWTHTNTTSFNVTNAGTFSCIVTNTLSSCTATVPITITTNTILPVATYTPICNSSSISLNASSSNGVALGWLAPTTPVSPISNPGTSTSVGIFTLTATNLTTGCKKTYTVESAPNISVSTNPSNSMLTCAIHTIQASTSSTSTSNYVITWSDGVTTTTANTLPILANGNYTTVVQIIGGCASQSVISINTNTAVGVSITSPTTEISCLTNSLALTANQQTGGIYTYTWAPSVPAATNNVYNVTQAGTYSVYALNLTNGCSSSATLAVTHETIVASFDTNPHQGLMPLPVTFSNTSINATDFNWDLGNGMTYTTTNAATIYNTQGAYTVTLTATKGFCIDTAATVIKVDLVSFFTVPNVFTPNGDGKNDIFTFNAINMGDISFTVFDRWGIKVFESTVSGNIKWDGKNKAGSTINDGTYFYVIKAIGLDDVKYDLKGTINVFQ